MSLREIIAQQALELPAEDRAYVADVIEQSLASGGFASDEIASAWALRLSVTGKAVDGTRSVPATLSRQDFRR